MPGPVGGVLAGAQVPDQHFASTAAESIAATGDGDWDDLRAGHVVYRQCVAGEHGMLLAGA